MEKILNNPAPKRSELRTHLFLLVLSGLLAYLFINTYVKKFTHQENEEISLAATLFFLGSIYTGRFLSQLWLPKNEKVPNAPLILLPIIITACAFTCVQFAGSLLDHRELMYGLFLVLPFFIGSLAVGMLIKLVRTKINNQLKEAEANMEHSQSELHLLQTQLSPHFLFNTLNNMYGLSISQHEKIPGLLLKLSDLLRYSVYTTRELFVPLKDELAYIDNYIGFEKMRLGDRLNLTTDIESITGLNYKIAPMLLIIFIENAFKHSKNTNDQKIFIEIALKIWGDSILFSLKNSYKKNIAKNDLPDSSSGFGLANALKRLGLLYPGKFDLKLDDSGDLYSVMLRITIQ